uniref:hypothetical protein n=1 Tax=Timspurckia oligopyrenoides TaxID=708627 RepID=UPI001FCDAEF6|nr:hypothetical protein MW591_pgp118 [Timspurckia oligopyrenoides]UNJ17497.1 hypothetical protein [Timspurckia oligopyrenoides]
MLAEHLLLTLANDVCTFVLESRPRLVYKLCKKQYSSIRSFGKFRNNLAWQKFVRNHLQEPKYICENVCPILYITDYNIIKRKYIKIDRVDDFVKLKSIQYYTALLLEAVDFILPRLYDIVYYIGEMIFFLVNNFFIKDSRKHDGNRYKI